jgi:hypothetical protein
MNDQQQRIASAWTRMLADGDITEAQYRQEMARLVATNKATESAQPDPEQPAHEEPKVSALALDELPDDETPSNKRFPINELPAFVDPKTKKVKRYKLRAIEVRAEEAGQWKKPAGDPKGKSVWHGEGRPSGRIILSLPTTESSWGTSRQMRLTYSELRQFLAYITQVREAIEGIVRDSQDRVIDIV